MPRHLLILACTLACSATAAANDPWMRSGVLERLYGTSAHLRDAADLNRQLRLTDAQDSELRRLASSERKLALRLSGARSRAEATAFRAQLMAFRTEEDRKVRAALGGKYDAFRTWVRTWWTRTVQTAR
ncbi:hypothetical protein [Deinococcus maricopensis]|uniref:Periplasmic heavy metal sensor n=1 Tax=Deinococcus maricopensis (strain DSM 21211 / LMG 22137 / NRRL B-23946 / LB-34) TaxID=709986 RepID=E8UAB3_DEIML|nr:hypothetical protein [Deinococcus maricopensis]ADV68002.1 hypothetical protein Deima_2364 [Deinococcus maricopensis DSM 21211]